MSGRSCSAARSVFFIAQAKVFETVPQGGEAQAHFEFARNPLLEFGQRQIGLFLDPAAQLLVVPLQAGAPIASALLGLDVADGRLEFAITFDAALGNLEEPGDLCGAVSALSGRDDAFAEISAVGLHADALPQIATD